MFAFKVGGEAIDDQIICQGIFICRTMATDRFQNAILNHQIRPTPQYIIYYTYLEYCTNIMYIYTLYVVYIFIDI